MAIGPVCKRCNHPLEVSGKHSGEPVNCPNCYARSTITDNPKSEAVVPPEVTRTESRYTRKRKVITGIIAGLVFVLLFLVVIVPAVLERQEMQRRLLCMTKLKAFESFCVSFATVSGGNYPVDVKELIDWPGMPAIQLTCPNSDSPTGSFEDSYIYIGGQTTASDSRNVLAYEIEHNHENGGNVIFIDGRVLFIEPYSEVERLVNKTKERLGK